jgi:hypothetical protein
VVKGRPGNKPGNFPNEINLSLETGDFPLSKSVYIMVALAQKRTILFEKLHFGRVLYLNKPLEFGYEHT